MTPCHFYWSENYFTSCIFNSMTLEYRMLSFRSLIILLLLPYLCTALQGQRVLIEEFTNLQAENYSETHNYTDQFVENPWTSPYCVITYHTENPEVDALYANTTSSAQLRLNTLPDVTEFPSVLIDGKNKPTGQLHPGYTPNLTEEYLDSIYQSKEDLTSFFGVNLVFTDDFASVYASSGLHTTDFNPMTVLLYRVLVEEVVDFSKPVGPNGEQQFTNIFRGFINHRTSTSIPGNGSTHGWQLFTIPPSVQDLDNLKLVVFITDFDGNVLDCTAADAEDVDDYAVTYWNDTNRQFGFCDTLVSPEIKIRNDGAKAISNFTIQATVNKDTLTRFIQDTLFPAEIETFAFESFDFDGGGYAIDVDIVSIPNVPPNFIEPAQEKTVHYLIHDELDAPNEDFESPDPCDYGDFMQRAQQSYVFQKVNSEMLGAEQPIGGYGTSESCLLVDYGSWQYDSDFAVVLSSDFDNPNYGFLHYNGFDVTQFRHPVLKFDYAAPQMGQTNDCFVVGASTEECEDQSYDELLAFRCHELATIEMPDTSFYLPRPEDWNTLEIPLFAYEDETFLQLRLLANTRTDGSNQNALYLDNIRIESQDAPCQGGDITLTSQEEVDQFAASLAGCQYYDGNICIGYCDGETSVSDIISLAGLESLYEISGYLHISNNPSLKDVQGLDNLRSIGGYLEISNNAGLISLEHLTPDRTLGGGLYLMDNPNLKISLDFTGVKELGGDCIISGNPLKTFYNLGTFEVIYGDLIFHDTDSVSSFISNTGNLTFVDGCVSVENNRGLRFSNGMKNIVEINGDLSVKNNLQLRSLLLFDLERVRGNIDIQKTDTLTSITLISLDQVDGQITIADHPKLDYLAIYFDFDIDYLNSIEQHPVDFTLSNNPLLAECNIPPICAMVEDDSIIKVIENNALGCRTVDEVRIVCTEGPDEDQDGYGALVDCDDTDPAINPGAEETCDGIDNNCNDNIDEGLTLYTYYEDSDNDGYGNDDQMYEDCEIPAWGVTQGGDCNDNNSAINPGAEEICDDLDNNCNQSIDEGLPLLTYYEDNDNDGFGNDDVVFEDCQIPFWGVTQGGDCNDMDASINPDAIEDPTNDIDENCDGIFTNIDKLGEDLLLLTVFPNPVSTVLHIDIKSGSTSEFLMELLDIHGKAIARSQNNQLNVKSYPQGIYMVKITDMFSQQSILKKVLIQD